LVCVPHVYASHSRTNIGIHNGFQVWQKLGANVKKLQVNTTHNELCSCAQGGAIWKWEISSNYLDSAYNNVWKY